MFLLHFHHLWVKHSPNSRLRRDKNYSKYLANFIKEAKQLAKLGMNPHPNIVRVSDFFEEDDLPCIVMDYIPGNSLYDMVQINGALPEEQALRYIKQIGSALLVCHQQGIIHRDAHPNNILIHANSGKAILIDFGISGSTQTSRSNRSGNQAFAPWEQLISFGEESSKTPQVDIYTLAASFYYLVTGDTPTPSLARKFNNDGLKEPQQYNSQVSDRTNEAILKGMEIEVKDRPQSVKAWLEMFEKATVIKEPTHIKNFSEKKEKREYRGSIFLDIFEFETIKIEKRKISSGFLSFGKKRIEIIFNKEKKLTKCFTEDLGNGITLDMIEIPAGTFMMGSPENEIGRDGSERPQHEVTVPSFYMSKFEVTQAQWKQVAALPKINRILTLNPSTLEGDNLPVVNVSWLDVVEFCKRLSKATKKRYRLPTEAEWEYACRAGTTTPFYFGETITTDLANFKGALTHTNKPKGEYRGTTTPVGSFPPNAFGLYDMHGNVYEWCLDSWHNNYNYAPNDGSAWFEKDSNFFVLRGGSWDSMPLTNCRSAHRNKYAKGKYYCRIGFRCALSNYYSY